MPLLIEDDDIDLDALFKSVETQDTPANMYISDSKNAVKLLAELIRNEKSPPIHRIESLIDQMFELLSDISLDNELEFYERFMDLCARLIALQKVQKLQRKAVVGFGGKFSSGKSRFINAISGIQDPLPVKQEPTTSIPTYIIRSDRDALYANSIYGYTTPLTPQSLNALTHEFYIQYSIGFSAFLDNIIVESRSFSLPDCVALLDTPGYTKFDEKSNSKMALSDRQRALEQLRVSDYLIWLVDIENGGMTQDDIEFLQSLKIRTKILIVFTKADKKTETDIQKILNLAQRQIYEASIPYFGITAYSSTQKQEYGNTLIPSFFRYVMFDSARSNDVRAEINGLEKQLRQSIVKAADTSSGTAREVFNYLAESRNVMQVRSLANLWGTAQQNRAKIDRVLKQYDKKVAAINKELRRYIKSEV